MKEDKFDKQKECEEDPFQAAEEQHALIQSRMRRQQIYRILTGGFLVVAAIAALFFADIVEYFARDQKKQAAVQAEKTVVFNDAQRQAFLEPVKRTIEQGNLSEARSLLLKHLEKDPTFADANYWTGVIYLRQGKVQVAHKYLQEALKLRPNYYAAQERLGEIYLLAGDKKAAREMAGKLSQADNYLQQGLLLESEALLAEGKLELALSKADDALQIAKAPSKVRISTYLADLYIRKGDKKRAAEIVGKINLETASLEELLSLAKVYSGAGNDALALLSFQQALKRFPESAEVNYRYGLHLFNKGKFRDATVYYQKALTAAPHAEIIGYRLCESMLAAGRTGEAKKQIDSLTVEFPNSILILGLKFQSQLLAGDRPQARDTLNRITALVPNAPRPYIVLANLYWQDGMVVQAEKNAYKAMKLGEKTVYPHLMIGDILFARGQLTQALAYYERVLEVQPDNIVALLQTGDILLQQGQHENAGKRYMKAAALYPKNKSLKTKIAWAKARGGDYEGALAMNREYLRENPKDPQASLAYANTLVAANRLDEALEVMKRAIGKLPGDSSLRYLAGDIYILKNDFKSAAENYASALTLSPGDVNLALNIGSRYEKYAPEAQAERYYLDIRNRLPNSPLVINQLAWFYVEKMNAPRKAAGFIEVLKAEKERPELKDTIGWHYFKTGDFSAAERYLREALTLDPNQDSVRAHLALTLFALQKNSEAAAEAQKIITRLSSGPLKDKLNEALAKEKNKL